MTRTSHLYDFRNILLALFLMASAGMVNANTTNLGSLPEFPQSYDFLVSHTPGSFTDNFYFEIGSPQRVSNTAVSLNLRFNPNANFNVSALRIAFYDLSNTFYGIANGIGEPQEAVLEQTLLAGNYYASISGIADGSAGGKYAYSISAIPEAEQWLLMLMGFAAVSFVTYRRRRR